MQVKPDSPQRLGWTRVSRMRVHAFVLSALFALVVAILTLLAHAQGAAAQGLRVPVAQATAIPAPAHES